MSDHAGEWDVLGTCCQEWLRESHRSGTFSGSCFTVPPGVRRRNSYTKYMYHREGPSELAQRTGTEHVSTGDQLRSPRSEIVNGQHSGIDHTDIRLKHSWSLVVDILQLGNKLRQHNIRTFRPTPPFLTP